MFFSNKRINVKNLGLSVNSGSARIQSAFPLREGFSNIIGVKTDY